MRSDPWVGMVCCAGLLVPLTLHADLRMVVKSGNHKTIEYVKGNLSRWELQPGGQYAILDSATHRLLRVDPATRQYYEFYAITESSPGNLLKTISIEVNSRDKGEQRTMFGHQAHHWIITTKTASESPGKPPRSRERTDDLWYLDVDDTRPARTTMLQTSIYAQKRPTVQITRIGPTPRGVPVSQKTGASVTEVVELSEAPIDPKLFQPPSNFRRTIQWGAGDALPWSDRMDYFWQRFEEWLDSAL